MLKKLYIFLFIISFYFIINTPKKHYDYSNDDQWDSKLYLVYSAVFILFISIFYINPYINKYILPLLILLNIAWPIYATFNFDIFNNDNWKRFIPLPVLIYTLLSVNFKRLESKNGIFINPDTNWIYLQTLAITLWYIYTCPPCSVLPFVCCLISSVFRSFAKKYVNVLSV